MNNIKEPTFLSKEYDTYSLFAFVIGLILTVSSLPAELIHKFGTHEIGELPWGIWGIYLFMTVFTPEIILGAVIIGTTLSIIGIRRKKNRKLATVALILCLVPIISFLLFA